MNLHLQTTEFLVLFFNNLLCSVESAFKLLNGSLAFAHLRLQSVDILCALAKFALLSINDIHFLPDESLQSPYPQVVQLS